MTNTSETANTKSKDSSFINDVFSTDRLEDIREQLRYNNFLAILGPSDYEKSVLINEAYTAHITVGLNREKIQRALADRSAEEILNDEEYTICLDLGKGLTNDQLSARHSVSDDKVDALVKQIFEKLQIHNHWHIVKTQPGLDPLGNLADSLNLKNSLHGKEIVERQRVKILKKLKSGNSGLIEIFQDAHQVVDPKDFKLLIIVDKLEDLYRFKGKSDIIGKSTDDVHFVNLLLNAVKEEKRIHVIFITNADELSNLLRYKGLPELINLNNIIVPFIQKKEIRIFFDKLLGGQLDSGVRMTYQDSENLINEYAILEGDNEFRQYSDIHRFYKLHHTLVTGSKNSKSTYEKNRIDISINEYFDKIYKGLKAETPVLMSLKRKICQKLFQAVSNNDPDEKENYQPVLRGKLADLCWITVRSEEIMGINIKTQDTLNKSDGDCITIVDKEFIDATIDEIIFQFNQSQFPCFTSYVIPGPKDSSKSMIEISSPAILANWYQLSDWIKYESVDSNAYKLLVEDAIAYYAKEKLNRSRKTIPQQSEILSAPKPGFFKQFTLKTGDFLEKMVKGEQVASQSSERSRATGLWEGGQLQIGLNWQRRVPQNETWAIRYFPAIPDERSQEDLRENYDSLSDQAHSFRIARKFLEESITHDKDKKAKARVARETQIINAKKWSRRLTIAALVFLSLSVLAVSLMFRAMNDRENLKLIDYSNNLVRTNIISVVDNSSNLEFLKREILNQDSIDSPRKVLNFFVDKNVLKTNKVDTNAELYNELSLVALTNLQGLFEAMEEPQKNKESIVKGARDLINRYHRDSSLFSPDKEFRQVPYLYYALEEYRKDLEKLQINGPGSMVESKSIKESSVISSVSSNPKRAEQYAYGNNQGEVYVIDENPVSKRVAQFDSRIMSLNYTPAGNYLFVVTSSDEIYQISNVTNVLKESGTQILHNIRNINYVQPISVNELIVGTPAEVVILSRRTGDNFSVRSRWVARNQIGISEINAMSTTFNGNYDLVSDLGKYILVGGAGASAILHLDNGNRLNTRYILRHAGIRISAVDIFLKKVDHIESERALSIALGSETGQLWVGFGHEFINDLRLTSANHNAQYLHNIHKAEITDLEFGIAQEQLASCSLDGTIRLWNLKMMEQDFDHLRLEDNGHGINIIKYINGDDIVTIANNYRREWKTNHRTLTNYLEKVLNRTNL